MHEGFFDIDHEREQRLFPIDHMALANHCVPDNTGFASNTQSIAMPWHNEQECHIWVFYEVLKAINTVISEPIRNDQRFIIIDFNKPSGVAFRRYVDQPF